MGTKFIVAEGQEFSYPADEISYQLLKNAGGRSKLPEAERVLVTYKTATEGQDCSDMPVAARDQYVSLGLIIVQDEQPKAEEKSSDGEEA